MNQWIQLAFRLQCAAWRIASRCVVLPVTCLLSRKERHRLWRLWDLLFGSSRTGVYPEVGLEALIDPTTTVRLSNLVGHSYNVTPFELLSLAALTAHLRPNVAFEFGTADGRTTLYLALHTSPTGRVYTLNLPLEQDLQNPQKLPLGYYFLGSEAGKRIVQLIGDSKTFDLSAYFGRCQLIFIDADHFEPSITHDSLMALRMIDRRFGAIVWHDALRYDVQTALPAIARQYGPIHLVSGSNLAILCFVDNKSVPPSSWKMQTTEGS